MRVVYTHKTLFFLPIDQVRMKNNFVEQARNFVYYATKNLEELQESGIYDDMVYLVLMQELSTLNSTIEGLLDNTELPMELKDAQLRDEVTEAMKHVSHPSLKETLSLFEIDVSKINTRLMNFLEITTTVVCAQLGDDVSGKNSKFIEIQQEDEVFGDNMPNVFDLSVPCSVPGAIISIDEDGNCFVKTENRRLIITVLFKQDWLLLSISSYTKSKLNITNKKGLWNKYGKVVGSGYVAFSNKFGLNVTKIMDNYIENKAKIEFLSESAEELFQNETKSDVLEYLKLFYLDGKYDKASDLYDKLTSVCGKQLINTLIPKTYLEKFKKDTKGFIVPDDVAEKIKEKEEECERSPDPKPKRWLDSIKKMPFGVIKKDRTFSFVEGFLKDHGEANNWKNFMDVFKGIKKCKDKTAKNQWAEYLKDRQSKTTSIKTSLDNAVYGHENVKKEIINLSSEWMNGGMKGTCIGLQGPPGNGKTSIAKDGICKAFVDENGNEFPYIYISLGAANNGSYLFGHHYTFQGSVPGQIAEGLIKSKCMNPIFYFDELDKISQTESGKELINTLIHITDFTQNDSFEDMYFAGIKLDLSKCLFIFSFNDVHAIDRVLKDRLHIIKTNPLNIREKIVIGRDYLMKDICKNIGWNMSDVVIPDQLLSYIVRSYTLEPGVRKYKNMLIKIMRKYNHDISEGKIKGTKLPLKLSEDEVDDVLDINNKVRLKMTHKNPTVGLINGLYCIPSYGLGGTIPLQAKQTFPQAGKDGSNITVTGNLGKVMSESVACAKTAIWGILNEVERKKLAKEGLNLHLHAMDAASEKEGPSAGGAITLCMYSLITNKKIRNNIAMTGEITLDGEISEIGGVAEKINGGNQVGCNIILLPHGNRQEFDIAVRDGCFDTKIRVLKDKEWTEHIKGNELCVKFVETIDDVIKMAIVKDSASTKKTKTTKKSSNATDTESTIKAAGEHD